MRDVKYFNNLKSLHVCQLAMCKLAVCQPTVCQLADHSFRNINLLNPIRYLQQSTFDLSTTAYVFKNVLCHIRCKRNVNRHVLFGQRFHVGDFANDMLRYPGILLYF